MSDVIHILESAKGENGRGTAEGKGALFDWLHLSHEHSDAIGDRLQIHLQENYSIAAGES